MPSKSNDPVDRALIRAVDTIVGLVDEQATPAPVILIDGRSGAGKTSLSRRLHIALPDSHLLALDSVYSGWDGLRAGADQVLHNVLLPRAHGAGGTWSGWDWHLDEPAGAHDVPADGVLIVEGAGILTPASAATAAVCVWVEAADHDRKRRALTRDGDAYAPHWERWARQEDHHIRAHQPRSLADVVVDIPGD